MKLGSIRDVYVYALGSPLHIHKPLIRKKEGLHAAFVHLVPMEMTTLERSRFVSKVCRVLGEETEVVE